MRLILALLTLGLLALAVACADGDEAPVATDTPATPANAATATVAVEPTALPDATVTPPVATATPRPDVERPCPIDDDVFCDFADSIDRALRSGDIDTILALSKITSFVCPGATGVGPCARADEGQVLEGYFVGAAHTDGGAYAGLDQFRAMLTSVANVPSAALDEYGDSAWSVWAVLDQEPERKVLVTTSIGPDPIYDDVTSVRRVFTLLAGRQTDGWVLETFITTVFIETTLAGVDFQGAPLEGWVLWSEQ